MDTNTEEQMSNALNGLTQELASLFTQLTPQRLLSLAESRVAIDLAKPNCAKDFKNVSKDLNKLNQLGFKNLGTATFNVVDGISTTTDTSGAVGQYNPFTGSINLNSQINWLMPSLTIGIVNGIYTTVDLLGGEATQLQVSSITAAQYMDIVILHELAHYNGSIGNPDNLSVERQIFKDCIQ